MRVYYKINDVIGSMLEPLSYRIRKAGIWQATELFQDMNMRVLRDVVLQMEIPPKTYTKEWVKADQPWSEIHFNERISGLPLNPGESYKTWPYNTFKNSDDPFIKGKKFSHTYMERFWPKEANEENKPLAPPIVGIRYDYGDLDDVIKQLKDNPLTRQAYLPIFFPEDTGAVHGERVPCTLGYLFENWDGVLDITYYIRSCDIFRHFRNDIYLAMRLAQHVADETGTSVGKLTMHIANLHLFENDVYAFTKKETKLRENE